MIYMSHDIMIRHYRYVIKNVVEVIVFIGHIEEFPIKIFLAIARKFHIIYNN